jgi:hypothetical protein
LIEPASLLHRWQTTALPFLGWAEIAAAAVHLKRRFLKSKSETEELLDWAREALIDIGGQNAFARFLGASAPYLGRVLAGEKALSPEMSVRFRQLQKFSYRSPAPQTLTLPPKVPSL